MRELFVLLKVRFETGPGAEWESQCQINDAQKQQDRLCVLFFTNQQLVTGVADDLHRSSLQTAIDLCRHIDGYLGARRKRFYFERRLFHHCRIKYTERRTVWIKSYKQSEIKR